ncbi:TetR/AcrR family transcriptional regulator [Aeromicrobium sp. Sec7.5]|uniref:TetR/AcrR family transcriptional regulator n=1 Tax=Aeromicrobium sp. Sec7.5 TaxID=3121276 RepID=UPI002FE4E227
MAPTDRSRRVEVLDGLVAMFLADGFLDLGLDEIAARLRCSKSTLYAVAPSKEQLITTVTREFFRRSTEQVEQRLAAEPEPRHRIRAYLDAIAEALAPASPAFYADVNDFVPAREVYRRNTAIAARRVQELVTDAKGPTGAVDATFVGAVAAAVMSTIQSGEMEASTSLDDAAAYRLLADLIDASVARATAP